MIDTGFPITTVCPPDSLCKVVGTIKAPGKVLGEPSLANLGYFYNFFASVVDEHRDNIRYFRGVAIEQTPYISRSAHYTKPLVTKIF